MTEPSLKRQRAESDVNPSAIARSSTTTNPNIPVYDLWTALSALDKSQTDHTFSQIMLVKLNLRDPSIGAQIRQEYHSHLQRQKEMQAEREQRKDFSHSVDALKEVIRHEEAKPAHLARNPEQIANCFITKMREIWRRTYYYSSFETKKSALNTLRRMAFAWLDTRDKELQKQLPGWITEDQSDKYCLGMLGILRDMSGQERKELANMPVDGATVATTEEMRRGGNRFMDKMQELRERLDETWLICGMHLYGSSEELFWWGRGNEDGSDDGSDGEDGSEDDYGTPPYWKDPTE